MFVAYVVRNVFMTILLWYLHGMKHVHKTHSLVRFYISLTVHLGITLVSNQLDELFSMYLFISLLYMFRATQCSSSGESNCVNTSSGIYRSV